MISVSQVFKVISWNHYTEIFMNFDATAYSNENYSKLYKSQ